MKHQDVTKLCADSLRSYLNDTHEIKLKSGHAHEIVAAFFGYKSRIAMLADNQCAISNLARAEFIVLDLPTPLVEQRLKSLDGLLPDFPSSLVLAQRIYSAIKDNTLGRKVYPDFRSLALALAEVRLSERMSAFGMNSKSLNWIKEVAIQKSEAELLMTAHFGYRTDAGDTLRYCKYDIRLPRIAANIGYGAPDMHETLYTGLTRTHSDEELDKMYPTLLYSIKGKP